MLAKMSRTLYSSSKHLQNDQEAPEEEQGPTRFDLHPLLEPVEGVQCII